MSEQESSNIVPILIGVGIGIVLGGAILILFATHPRSAELPVADVSHSAATNVVANPAAPQSAIKTDVAQPATEATPRSTPDGTLAPNTELPAEQVAEIRKKLKQIAIAFHNYNDRNRAFPPGAGAKANHALSWRVYLLPYIEEKPLYERFRLDEPWNSPHNLQLLPLMPEVFRTGESSEETKFVVFTGDGTAFRSDRAFSLKRCTDGTSKTILAIYTGGGTSVPWTKPDDLLFDKANPLHGIGPINGRIESVMFDASQLSLPGDITPASFAALVTPAGNELIDPMVLRSAQAASNRIVRAGGAGPAAGGLASQINVFNQRMHTVVQALHGVQNSQKRFPPAASYFMVENKPGPEISWRVMCLPWLEEQQLFKRYQRQEAWDGPSNRELLKYMPTSYAHPIDTDGERTRMQVFVGVGTPFEKKSFDGKRPAGPALRDVKDGLSKTILFAGSGADRVVPWIEPRDMTFDPEKPLNALGTIDPAGVPVAMFDGSVRSIAPDVDPQVFKSMVLMNDGQ